MTVGYFAPLPPARTGVADYAQGLLQGLQRKGRVLVGDPDTDVCLYQLGNNQLHGPIFDQAMRRPGVVLLHDAVLHHFFLGRLSEDEYVREFARNYGEWTCGLARDLWAARARSGVDPRYFEYPMLRSVVETAKAVIVHNPGAAAIALRHGARRVIEIPHWFQLPFPVATRARPSDGTFTIGIFGHLRETKRLQTVFRAFSRARRAADMTLLVAGEFASRDLERACAAEWTQPGIVRKGYLADREFWSHAASVDACVNLRYPAAGETSGIAIRLMGLGKPVVLSRGLETGRYPDEACLKADTGIAEEDTLAAFLIWMASHPDDARAIGHNAAEHIERHHSLERVADLFWDVLSSCA